VKFCRLLNIQIFENQNNRTLEKLPNVLNKHSILPIRN